jgi:hypothetical protein
MKRLFYLMLAICCSGCVTSQHVQLNESTSLPLPGRKGDHLLAFGGGYLPSGNQISLEKNVEYFQRLLAKNRDVAATTHLLFADGDNPGRDLQYKIPNYRAPDLERVMAELSGNSSGLDLRYRSNQLTGLAGPCTKKAVDHYFDAFAGTLNKGDRLFCYFTGHGGRGDKKTPYNTKLHLWKQEDVLMRDFVKRLDKVPADVPVVLVMVQCFSGGFQHVIFKDGDPKNGLSEHPRCGFFATVHSRVAAGCTPDIDEANYQEYSSFFWAALSGETRMGKTIELPDYDGNGKVTMDEAHAYVILTSDSIDIPVKTSDGLLAHYSKTKPAPPKKDEKKKDGEEADDKKDTPPDLDLVDIDKDFVALKASASVIDKTVLDGLAKQLGITDKNTVAAARKKADEIEKTRKKLDEDRKKRIASLRKHHRKIGAAMQIRWPEIKTRWHPNLSEILASEGDEVIAAMKAHPEYAAMKKLGKEAKSLQDQRFKLEKQQVKCKRLIHVAENLARAANLVKLADEKAIARYHELLELEHGEFGIGH